MGTICIFLRNRSRENGGKYRIDIDSGGRKGGGRPSSFILVFFLLPWCTLCYKKVAQSTPG
jgi:hypothetical protein